MQGINQINKLKPQQMKTAKEIKEYFNSKYPNKIRSVTIMDEYDYAGEGQWYGLLIFYIDETANQSETNRTFRNNVSIQKNIDKFERYFEEIFYK